MLLLRQSGGEMNSNGPKIQRWLTPIAAIFVGVTLFAHALDPILGHPIAHEFNTLSGAGKNTWNVTVVILCSLVLLVALASFVERLFWRFKRNRNSNDLDDNPHHGSPQ